MQINLMCRNVYFKRAKPKTKLLQKLFFPFEQIKQEILFLSNNINKIIFTFNINLFIFAFTWQTFFLVFPKVYFAILKNKNLP